jgi:hypothetical protein
MRENSYHLLIFVLQVVCFLTYIHAHIRACEYKLSPLHLCSSNHPFSAEVLPQGRFAVETTVRNSHIIHVRSQIHTHTHTRKSHALLCLCVDVYVDVDVYISRK